MPEVIFRVKREAGCRGELPMLVRQGFALFDRREYFEAHEVLETAWREENRPIRGLYRGILQVAVGYYHILRGNYTGALKMFKRARVWLALYPERCLEVDLAVFIKDFEAVEKEVIRLGPEHLAEINLALLKPVPRVKTKR